MWFVFLFEAQREKRRIVFHFRFSFQFAIIFLCLTVRSSSISIADRSNEEMSTERPMTTIETNDDSRDELENQSSFPNDEVIELNIGGQKMSTFRSTLTFLESSKLAQLFQNKQSEAKLFKDKDGAFFFDYNPIHFNYLLDQLRALKQKGKMPRQQILFQSPYISSPMNFSLMLKDLGLLRKSTQESKFSLDFQRFRLTFSQ